MISLAEHILQEWDAGERDFKTIADRTGASITSVRTIIYGSGRLHRNGAQAMVFELWDAGHRDVEYLAWKCNIAVATVKLYLCASGRTRAKFRRVLLKQP